MSSKTKIIVLKSKELIYTGIFLVLGILLILLLSGGVKERTIQGTSQFLINNMGMLFIPAVVGTLEYLDVLKLQIVPFLVVSIVSTPLVYLATAWSVQLLMKLFKKKEDASHD